MTLEPQVQVEGYLEAFHALQRDGGARHPAWLQGLRAGAAARFQELGFPTARRGNEEWKYTDVGPMARTPFRPAPPPGSVPGAAGLGPPARGARGWSRIVFVNGRPAPRLASLKGLPPGAALLDLEEALESVPGLLEAHLGRHAQHQGNAFVALNTALLQSGAVLHLPEGVSVADPVHVLFLTTGEAEGAHTQPRLLVVAGPRSRVTVVESHLGAAAGRRLTNAVTEVVVGEGASVAHHRVQREAPGSYHVSNAQVVLGRDSRFLSVALDLGGGLTRNNLNVLTAGEGASCTLNGVYLVGGSQHVDNQVVIDHAVPRTTSRELYKGVLAGRGRSVFHGSIVVRPGASKVDARQEDRNLLLSDQAEADTKPAFWIYNDDVRCGHGAACGKLDEAALFYLRSRGLDAETARGMLVRGFVGEVVGSIECPPLRAWASGLVAARLEEMLGAGATG